MSELSIKQMLSKFLLFIPEEDYKTILKNLLIKTKKHVSKKINSLEKERQIETIVSGMNFSMKDKTYSNLSEVLNWYYCKQSECDFPDTMEEAISGINHDNFIISTAHILHKYCRAPYIRKLDNLFESQQFKNCINNVKFDKNTEIKINNTEEKQMKYYIGCIEENGTFFNFRIYCTFDGTKLIDDEAIKNDYPSCGKLNLSYKLNNSSDEFLKNIVKNCSLLAISSSMINAYIKENRNLYTNDVIPNIQKQIDLQAMCDNRIDLSTVIFPASDLNIFKVATPESPEINDKLIDGTIILSDTDFEKEEKVLISNNGRLIGPYKLHIRSIDDVRLVKPNLGNKENKYILRYIENPSNEIVFRFPIVVSYSTSKIIEIAFWNEEIVKLEDIIPDEKLILELSSIYSLNTSSKDKTTLERLAKTTELLSSKLPDNIKEERKSRTLEIFENFDNLVGSKKAVIEALIYNSSLEQHQDLYQMLVDRLKELPEYKDAISKSTQTEAELTKVLSEKADLENKIRESQSVSSNAYSQKFSEDENKKIELENESLRKKKEETLKEIGELEEILKDGHEAIDFKKKKDQLENSCTDLENDKEDLLTNIAKLETKLEQMKKDFQREISKSFEEATRAFDPVISNMMLDAASRFQSDSNIEKYKLYYEEALDFSRTIKSKSKEELRKYLVEGIRKYRNYSPNDIINMYICISQGFLTIFAGNPGTGKTSICNIIANSLGLNKDFGNGEFSFKRYVPISVERGWSSKRDLVGYFNPLTKKYDKSNGKIYDALRVLDIEKENSKFPLIVLLDEANLSPIEYYWAEFMRIADRENDSTMINIGEESDLFVPETLKFVATINYDQTTEELSPRLIDRAWIIKLPESEMNASQNTDIESVFKECILWSDLKQLFIPTDKTTEIELEDVLTQIYEKFADAGIPISYRVKDSIRNYVIIAQQLMQDDGSANSKNLAIDYAVMQRLLPKINGSGYDKFLNEIIRICEGYDLLKTKRAVEKMLSQSERNLGYFQYL